MLLSLDGPTRFFPSTPGFLPLSSLLSNSSFAAVYASGSSPCLLEVPLRMGFPYQPSQSSPVGPSWGRPLSLSGPPPLLPSSDLSFCCLSPLQQPASLSHFPLQAHPLSTTCPLRLSPAPRIHSPSPPSWPLCFLAPSRFANSFRPLLPPLGYSPHPPDLLDWYPALNLPGYSDLSRLPNLG